MNEHYLVILLLGHFLSDFGLQTDEQAKGKSSSLKWLIYHTSVYSAVMLLLILSILPPLTAIEFGIITFTAHTITDYCTSRIGKPFWEKQDHHFGFVTIGFDQVLHYIQLYITLKLLL